MKRPEELTNNNEDTSAADYDPATISVLSSNSGIQHTTMEGPLLGATQQIPLAGERTDNAKSAPFYLPNSGNSLFSGLSSIDFEKEMSNDTVSGNWNFSLASVDSTTGAMQTSLGGPLPEDEPRAKRIKLTKTDWLGKYHAALSACRSKKLGTTNEAESTPNKAKVLPPSPSVAFAAAATNESTDETEPSNKRKRRKSVATSPQKSTVRATNVASSRKKPSKRSKRQTIPIHTPSSHNSDATISASTSRRKKSVDDRKYITEMEPSPMDVLAGRGGGANHHAGNERYWLKILEQREAYKTVKENDNLGKNQIAKVVLDHMLAKGRFLEREPKTRRLFELSSEVALSKIKQALRDKYIPLFARKLQKKSD